MFHCPFCHGWEVRDRPLAVLDGGGRASTGRCCCAAGATTSSLLTDGPAELEADDAAGLRAAGVAVDERPVDRLVGRDGELEEVAFADGDRLERSGLLVPAPLHQRSALAEQLGAAAGEASPVVVDPVGVDAKYATGAPGVSAAGDLSTQMPQVAGRRRPVAGRRDDRPDPGLRRAWGVVPAGRRYRRSASVVITAS